MGGNHFHYNVNGHSELDFAVVEASQELQAGICALDYEWAGPCAKVSEEATKHRTGCGFDTFFRTLPEHLMRKTFSV